ncbi:MAG: hypothetical protein KF709_14890 [Gemmatimonadaceae bacterium]|nr:hypothetical protein [Gemmatimonadaceae bacterium]
MAGAFLFVACKDNTGLRRPPIDQVVPGQTVETVVGSAGGTVSLLTTEGARFDLDLPNAALGENTTIRLSTVATTGDQIFHLRLAPAGLLLADGREAVLTVAVPGSSGFPATGAVLYDGVPLALERLGDGRVRLRLTAFADEPPPGLRDGGGPAVLDAQQAASTAPLCNGGPSSGTFASGGLIAVSQLELLIYGNCMVAAVQRLASSGAHADAIRAALSAAALLQGAGQQPGSSVDAAQFITTASGIACTAYRQVLDAASTATVTTFGTVQAVVRPVLFWEQVVQQLGTTCANVGATEYQTVVIAKTDQAIAFYESQHGPSAMAGLRALPVGPASAAITDVGSPEYAQALAEARSNRTLVQQVQTVPAGAAVKTFARAQMRDRAQPELLQAMLEAPWRQCRETGSYNALIELMEPMDHAEEIQEAAQYCGTLLAAESRDGNGGVLESLSPSLGGVSAIEVRAAGALRIETNGVVRLSGPIRALQCPVGAIGGSEQLQLRLNSTVLQSITAVPYLANVLELDVAQSLQAAGIDAQQFTQATLGLYRVGSPCGGYWGEAPAPLLAVTLQRGICVPAEGMDHCMTVLKDAANPQRLLQNPIAISDQNGYVLLGTSDGLAVWHKGATTLAPSLFNPPGTSEFANFASIADNGAVAGVLWDTEYPPNSFMPALWGPNTPLRSLLAQPITFLEPVLSWLGNNTTITRTPLSVTISPQGRATFTIYESVNAWPASDIGFCGTVQTGGGPQLDCARYRRFEALASGAGLASQEQEIAAPNTGAMNVVLFDGGTGVGRYGYLDSLAAIGGVGGIGAYRRKNQTFSARELASDVPAVEGRRHVAADRDGRTVSYTGSVHLIPASGAVPGGWNIGALSLAGQLQVCSQDYSITRLLKLSDGSTVMDVPLSTITLDGQSVMVQALCGYGPRAVDSLGRMLGVGWIEAQQREIPVIFTPSGVPLP